MEELPRVTMPFIDFDTGRGQIIAPVLIQAVPNTLDDNIDFIVRLPSGNDSGPTPSENLHMYGAMRKQAYYALLNLAYDWWEPGRTRIPVNSNGKRHWLQSYALERYKPVTNDDVIDLTAPLTANRKSPGCGRQGVGYAQASSRRRRTPDCGTQRGKAHPAAATTIRRSEVALQPVSVAPVVILTLHNDCVPCISSLVQHSLDTRAHV